MRVLAFAVVGTLLALSVACGGEEVRSVFAGADPFALAAAGKMYVYPTGGEADTLDVWEQDGAEWRDHGSLLQLGSIGWIRDDHAPKHFLWAPDMLAANGRYHLYYSVGPQDPTPSASGWPRAAPPKVRVPTAASRC